MLQVFGYCEQSLSWNYISIGLCIAISMLWMEILIICVIDLPNDMTR